MISVSIVGILAQLALPGCAPAEIPTLALDYSELDGYSDPNHKYPDTARIRSEATQTTVNLFSPYNVKVTERAPGTGLATLKNKMIHIIQNGLAASHCDEAWGCAVENGSTGNVFFQDMLDAFPARAVTSRGNWPGAAQDGMARILASTISHEAGHTYGLPHSDGGLMQSRRPIHNRIFNFWDAPSQQKLAKALGLKQP